MQQCVSAQNSVNVRRYALIRVEISAELIGRQAKALHIIDNEFGRSEFAFKTAVRITCVFNARIRLVQIRSWWCMYGGFVLGRCFVI